MAWGIVYYATKAGRVPAEEFLDSLPAKVASRFDVWRCAWRLTFVRRSREHPRLMDVATESLIGVG